MRTENQSEAMSSELLEAEESLKQFTNTIICTATFDISTLIGLRAFAELSCHQVSSSISKYHLTVIAKFDAPPKLRKKLQVSLFFWRIFVEPSAEI